MLAIAAFVSPPALVFCYLIGREWLRLRRERERLRLEEEASAAEGYPPPDPPTTDSQPL